MLLEQKPAALIAHTACLLNIISGNKLTQFTELNLFKNGREK